MSSPIVTVLIPTHKRPEKLRRAIQSVLAQTYTQLKIIVLDNASKDETPEVVRYFMKNDSRVVYYAHEENIGMNANFNFAVSKIDTPFFCFLTDDDYQLENFIFDALQGFKSFPDAKFSVMDAPVINEGTPELIIGSPLSVWKKIGQYEAGDAIRYVTTGHHPVLTACLFRETIKSDFYFDHTVGNISDLPILISIVAKYPFYLSRKVGLYFIRHPSALGSSTDWRGWLALQDVVQTNSTVDPVSMKSIQANLASRIDKICFIGLVHSVRLSDDILFDQIYVRFTTTNNLQYRTLSKTIWLLKQSRLTELLLAGIIRLVYRILHSTVRRH